MPRVIFLGAFLLLPVAGADDNEELFRKMKSASAKKAMIRFEQARADAQKEFDKSLAAATKALADDLEGAQAEATKSNDLDEAVAIRDVRRALAVDNVANRATRGSPSGQGAIWIGAGKRTKGKSVVKGDEMFMLVITEATADKFKAMARFWNSATANKPGFVDMDVTMNGQKLKARDSFGGTYEGTLKEATLGLKWVSSDGANSIEYVLRPQKGR